MWGERLLIWGWVIQDQALLGKHLAGFGNSPWELHLCPAILRRSAAHLYSVGVCFWGSRSRVLRHQQQPPPLVRCVCTVLLR